MEAAMQHDARVERPEARIMLQPMAPPSVLGYLALASGLFIWGSWFARTWGTEADASSFFPFLMVFGGFGQLGASLWSYRARAAVSAALFGSWGAFFVGLGGIDLLATTHTITVPARGAYWGSLGAWLIYMGVISWTTAVADLVRSPGGFLTQATLGAGALVGAIGLLIGSSGWQEVAGWLFVAAALLACYVGVGLMLEGIYGTSIVPQPGRAAVDPISYRSGDPGVKVGQ